MFAIAPTVLGWLDDGREVWIARVTASRGLAGREAAPVAAWAGDDTVGSPLALRARSHGPGRHELTVADADAEGVGLACGGSATVLVQRATELPEPFWAAVRRHEPAALLDTVDSTVAFDADTLPPEHARVFRRGVAQVAEVGAGTLTVYWPLQRVLVVGGGPVAEALRAQVALLGWQFAVVDGADTVTAIEALGAADAVVVLSHDRDVDGPALAAAVGSAAGYVGAMGSRHTQAARAQWFAEHGVTTGLERIHGPAGLDIGGFGPAEIALSITAEIVAVRSGETD